MNLILYEKTASRNNELKEFLINKSGANVFTASTKQEVINLFMKYRNIEWLVFLNVSLPSDLGMVQFVKDNCPDTKIIFFASPIVKESIEIIKDSDIILMDNDFEKLKEIHRVIKAPSAKHTADKSVSSKGGEKVFPFDEDLGGQIKTDDPNKKI